MKRFLIQALVVARRDFMAVVFTPTFLFFLLAPLFMIGFGVLGGAGANQMTDGAARITRIAAIADAKDTAYLRAADLRMRALYTGDGGPPKLVLVPSHGEGDKQVAAELLASKTLDHAAVMYGPLTSPTIEHDGMGERSSNYLAQLAEQAARDRQTGLPPTASASKPRIATVAAKDTNLRGQQLAAYGAVFILGFLTLFLAGQAVGMLAEEKSNKVIEILAAAAPLESVFFGKLIGMFGVAMLFVSFWGGLSVIGLVAVAGDGASAFAPAVGGTTFIILVGLYFAMAYMILGAVFLGVGAQASTMREIQMLSLPVTVFQMSMFGLAMAGVSSPGSTIQRVAEIVPFSSPFAMAARGATDPELWPHLVALLWQMLWVAGIITVGAKLFRSGVLKAGGGPASWFRRKQTAA